MKKRHADTPLRLHFLTTRQVGMIMSAAALVMMFWFCSSTLPLSFNGERPNDFPNYYVAGLRLFEERPIYEPLEAEVFHRLGFAHYPTNIADTPATVVLLAPLSRLTYGSAFFTLYFFSLVSVPLLTYFAGRYLGMTFWEAVCAVSLLSFSNHYRFLLLCNHMESILLLCLTFGWIYLKNGWDRTGGFFWGLAAALKLFPGLLLLLLMLSRWKRAALIGIIAAAVLLALAGVTIGRADSFAYIIQVIPQSQQWYGHDGNFSLMSIGYRLGGLTVGWTLTIAAVIVITVLVFKSRDNKDRIFAVGTAGMLLISPLSWLGYGILLIPVLLLLFSKLDRKTSRLNVWIFITALVLTQYWPFQSKPMISSMNEFLFFTIPPVCGYMSIMVLAFRLLTDGTIAAGKEISMERTAA
jgi:hypothetical protein